MAGYDGSSFEALKTVVIANSIANNWDDAVQEWDMIGVSEDETMRSSCHCGKFGIRYLYEIYNRLNGNTLKPIGSECIKRFGRKDLRDKVSITGQYFNLRKAIYNNEFVQLSSKYFSRKLLRFLFEQGAFPSSKYNKGNPENDYNFMLAMFNKKKRSEAQERKVRALLNTSIIPFVKNTMGRI